MSFLEMMLLSSVTQFEYNIIIFPFELFIYLADYVIIIIIINTMVVFSVASNLK